MNDSLCRGMDLQSTGLGGPPTVSSLQHTVVGHRRYGRMAVVSTRQKFLCEMFTEAPHVHVDNHVALIFHAESGRIIGGGMYPSKLCLSNMIVPLYTSKWFHSVRDKYKEVSKGGKLSFHGPVKYADNVMLKVSL